MKIIEKLIIAFFALILLFTFSYYFFVYKDVVLSLHSSSRLTGKIAYGVRGHEIKLVKLPSRENATIYTNPKESADRLGFVHYPSFSPDGRKIVFSRMYSLTSGNKLFIMDSDGGNVELFLDLKDIDTDSPSWSPDGRYIAFVSQGKITEGLFIVNVADKSVIQLSNTRPAKVQPSWSPDSKKIAFSSELIRKRHIKKDLFEKVNLGGTYIIDIETKNIEKYIDLAGQPSWSPDGKVLICEKLDGYYIVNLEEEIANPLPELFIPLKTPLLGKGGSFPLSWSRDGKYIAFCKEIWPGKAGIYAASIDNPKRQIRIATDDDSIIGMSWGR